MSKTSQDWYLRIEAVNLDHSVYDTNDISTIRGGSSLLLDAVNKLTESIGKLKKVSVGASTGLYRIDAQESEIQGVEQDVKNFLRSDPYCHFATFVVATAASQQGESIATLNKRLITECAWQQYKMPSFSFPALTEATEECGFGGVRPGICDIPGKEKKASLSVDTRRNAGKRLRKTLYEQCFDGSVPDFQLTDDLEELAQGGDITVIHFDGNRFGNIRDHCSCAKDYKQFDDTVQGIHKAALKAIIDEAIEQEKKKTKQTSSETNSIRLETLLWGGDEIELVVPATRAWETLKLFFDSVATASFQTEAGNSLNLTYSAGVVFCRHNIPILQVRQYAEQLCSLAKQPLSDMPVNKISSSDNRIAYLNMSSFDIISREVEPFIISYHQPAKVQDFTFTMNEIGQLHSDMLTITRSFPKNKIYEIVELLQRNEPVDKLEERALKMVASSVQPSLKEAISRILKGRKERWLLIGDLWNLIGTQPL